MAFDIYGSVLREDHCEVHPSVHESYPCSMCYMENEIQRQRQEQPDERDWVKPCEMAAITQQRDSLIQDVENLKSDVRIANDKIEELKGKVTSCRRTANMWIETIRSNIQIIEESGYENLAIQLRNKLEENYER